MEQYRFDPYNGQPLNPPRPVNNRTWLGSGYQSGGQAQAPVQPPARQEQPGVIFRPVASFDEAKAVPTDFSGALTIIGDVKYQMAADTCDIKTSIRDVGRDIIDNQNANYRGLMDFMVQSKIDALQAENQNLKLAASQANQNAAIGAMISASEATILRRTGAECPTAAYVVQPPTPVNFPTNGCGQFSGWNNGCDCGGNRCC